MLDVLQSQGQLIRVEFFGTPAIERALQLADEVAQLFVFGSDLIVQDFQGISLGLGLDMSRHGRHQSGPKLFRVCGDRLQIKHHTRIILESWPRIQHLFEPN